MSHLTLETWLPAIGNPDLLERCKSLLLGKCSLLHTHVYVIDNGSRESLKRATIRNEENVGIVRSLVQARANCKSDILVFQHTDFFIYERGWDKKIVEAFEADPKLGMLGAAGAIQADADGGRSHVVCTFRDWQSHGQQASEGVTPVALLDGCFLAIRVAALDALHWPPEESDQHSYFFYDKELSLNATMASWRVGVIKLDCEHQSGMTVTGGEYVSPGDPQVLHDQARDAYLARWGKVLPLHVTPEYVVHVGRKLK